MDEMTMDEDGTPVLRRHICGWCKQGIDPKMIENHIMFCERHPARKYLLECLELRKQLEELRRSIK